MISAKAAKILGSKWVEPKKKGLGYQLKKGAPENVKKEFEKFQRLLEGNP